MKTFAIAAAALLAGSLTGIAQASTTVRDVQQQVVRYADLDLEKAADAAVLHDRIKFAARKVCGLRSGPMPLEIVVRQELCVSEAMARAVADVDAPLLTSRGALVVRNIVE